MRKLLLILTILFCALPLVAQEHGRHALVFGLGEQKDPAWAKINGDKDVGYVVELLDAMGYTDIVTLKNEQATKQAMVDAFAALAARCNRGDAVYVHYSGHGQLMTDLNGDESFKWSGGHSRWDESWIPYDAYMVYGDNDRGERHFSDDEVARCLTAVRERIGDEGALIVVVDACHSGDATCGVDEAPVRGVGLKFGMPIDNAIPIEKPMPERWMTISACKPFQLNMEMTSPQVGKLTYALYTMGKGVFDLENDEIEALLRRFMDEHRGPLPQSPVVSGMKFFSSR